MEGGFNGPLCRGRIHAPLAARVASAEPAGIPIEKRRRPVSRTAAPAAPTAPVYRPLQTAR